MTSRTVVRLQSWDTTDDLSAVRTHEARPSSPISSDATVAPTTTVVAGTAAPGTRPAAAIGEQTTMTVRIESVDPQHKIVVFTPASGGLRAIRVRTPEGQRFIEGLNAGDSVDITWTEAMAVAVTER